MTTMRKLRTVLNMAPQTRDEEHERRKRELHQLDEAMHSYTYAMRKTKDSVDELLKSFLSVCKAFDKMTSFVDISQTTKSCTKALRETVDHIESSILSQFNNDMRDRTIPAVSNLRNLYNECIRLENERNKIVREYDVYRAEVSKKEIAYEKKSKDLSTSKSYSSDVAKRDDLELRFEVADEKFKESHNSLIQSHAVGCTNGLHLFVTSISSVFLSMASDFKALQSSSQYALDTTQPPTEQYYDYNF